MTGKQPSRAVLLTAAAASVLGAAAPALSAESSFDLAEALALDPLETELAGLELRLGGSASAAVYSATQSGGPAKLSGHNASGTSSVADANLRLQRILDNGMVLGARGDVLLYRDELSSDNYDNDTVQRLYVFAQTGFGRVEIGQTDGAAFSMGLTGPQVADDVSLENPNISLFRDPTTGLDFTDPFQSTTAVQATSNFAKINYVSPRLFGIQIGAAFTPGTVRTPLPFTGNPSDDPDSQQNIWEIAAGYTAVYSGVAVGISAGYARGALRNATLNGADLYDRALGAQFAYTISDVRVSLGGALRDTNAFLLNPNSVASGTATRAGHLSTTAEWGSWRLGGEYSKSDVRGPVAYRIIGYEAALAYQLNDNLEINAGWQWQDFRQAAGVFYNGLSTIAMNAGFLALRYAL